MKIKRSISTAALLTLAALPITAAALETAAYAGPCDASAAVALSADTFVMGNDENDTLRIYRRDQSVASASLPLSAFLGSSDHEADIEGATTIGSRIYWIASHSRNSKAKRKPGRHRIFATDIQPNGTLKTVGAPYIHLLRDLSEDPTLKPYGLADAARLAAEAEGGLNIEGLAATSDGKLLIGFRNPLQAQRALVVTLENPAEIIEGQRAKLGAANTLDLGGRGIRSMELIGSSYLIVAGPIADSGSFALYKWSGKTSDAPKAINNIKLGSLRPEALFAIPQSSLVQLLSDDGGIDVRQTLCKKLPKAQQSFRSLIFGS